MLQLAVGIKGVVRRLQVLEKSICKKRKRERDLAWLGPIALIASVRFFLNTLATATMNVLYGESE